MRPLNIIVGTTLIFFLTLSIFLMTQTSSIRDSVSRDIQTSPEEASKIDILAQQASNIQEDTVASEVARGPISPSLTQGHVIMPQLDNETIKAELGRASWKLFHTILARFPEKPTLDEREALTSYIHLFARLYPCGECAVHFQGFLAANPPQTSSREAASQWGCHIHNKVNESLNKKIFDCSTIAEVYKCGCEDEEDGDLSDPSSKSKSTAKTKAENTDSKAPAHAPLKFENSGLTRGG